jgi:excisionase family DNA binding protein
MAMKRIDPRRIKLHRTYSVEEAADRLGIHKNTVRGWQRRGLESIDHGRPVLFQGAVLRAFLERQRAKAKAPCPPGTLYCLKCRQPRAPALGMVDYVPRNGRAGNLSALCGTCGRMMNRAAALTALPMIMAGIEVRILAGPSTHKLAALSLPEM